MSLKRIRVSHNVKLKVLQAAARKVQTTSEWIRQAWEKHGKTTEKRGF